MKQLNRYTGISLLIHLLVILWLASAGFSLSDKPVPEVYEVDIVAGPPSSAKPPASANVAATKYMYSKKRNTLKSLDEIQKEKALPAVKPDFSPSKIEPPERSQEPEPDYSPPPGRETASRNPAAAAGQGGTGRTTDENAYLLGLWVAQVKGVVDRVWKTPPEISSIDKSLKTTYLLRISRSGELLDKRLLISSGNTPFDRSIQNALSSVRRLPQPPFALISGRDSMEVTMSFNPPKGAN